MQNCKCQLLILLNKCALSVGVISIDPAIIGDVHWIGPKKPREKLAPKINCEISVPPCHRISCLIACGRKVNATCAVLSLMWEANKLLRSIAIFLPSSVNTCSILFTAGDNGHPVRDRRSQVPVSAITLLPRHRLTNPNYISSGTVMFRDRYSRIEIWAGRKIKTFRFYIGCPDRMTRP